LALPHGAMWPNDVDELSAVLDIVHDHTSALITIQAQWNLPALS
jgi:hypothetical protein